MPEPGNWTVSGMLKSGYDAVQEYLRWTRKEGEGCGRGSAEASLPRRSREACRAQLVSKEVLW